MAKLNRKPIQDSERIIEFDLVRATEAAALNASQWLGKGNKNAADQAACDAIRGMFDLIPCCGEVVIGEGIKDERLQHRHAGTHGLDHAGRVQCGQSSRPSPWPVS